MESSFSIKNIFWLNVAVLIIATSAILARYMSLDPKFMTWARCLIGSMALLVYLLLRSPQKLKLHKSKGSVIVSGVLLCIHWVLFFYSILIAGVAVAAVSVFTYPIFMALLEPLIRGTTLVKRHLAVSAMILVGLYFISPEFSLQSDTFVGVLCGLGSALAYAIRNIQSKDLLAHYDSQQLMFFQLAIVAVLLLPFSTAESLPTIQANLIPLITLGILPTVIGHAMLVHSFQHFSSSQAGILTGAQPVYSILLAIIFLSEYPSEGTLIGGAIIVGAIIYEMSVKK